MAEKIGFIGLGNMGKPMAKNLVRAGFEVTVFDIRQEPVKELAKEGARSAKSSKEVAQMSDVIISMVLDDLQTEEVIQGKRGILEGARRGSTIIISSTVSPALCVRMAEVCREKDVGVLDAAVSGAPMGAEAGTLTLMVGGNEELFRKYKNIFETLGKNLFYFGGAGMGQVAKAVNNALLHCNSFAAMEGLNLAVKAGIKLERMLELVKTSTGNSWPIEHWDFYSAMKRQKNLQIPYKDLEIALGIAKELGYDMPIASLCLQLDLYQLPELAD